MKRLKVGDTVVNSITGEPIEDPHVGLNKGYIRFISGNLEFNREGLLGSGKEVFTIYKNELKVFKDFVKKL